MNLEDVRYWLEDLELRKKLEENQSLVVIGLIVVILFCLTLVVCQFTGGGTPSYPQNVKLVYFDLGNQTVRVVDHEYAKPQASPLEGTDDVFMATVFSCEGCEKGKLKDGMTRAELKANGMYVGWLQRMPASTDGNPAGYSEGFQYRTVDTDRWYDATDPASQQIIQAAYGRCDASQICAP